MKFFAQSKVNWNRFQPTDLVFKSNAMVKKIVPSENILSYSTKQDRDVEMAQRSGGAEERKTSWNGQTYTYYSRDKYRAVHVKLKDLKSPYPTADLEFVDFTPKEDSVGNTFNHITSLVYICSFHQRSQWVKGANGQYTTQMVGKVAQLDEGYRVAYGGQGESNHMGCELMCPMCVWMLLPASCGTPSTSSPRQNQQSWPIPPARYPRVHCQGER